MLLRYAVSGKPAFLYSAAVLATETIKAALSILWVLSTGGSLSSIGAFMRDEWHTFLRVLIPAGVYNCQQMLEFVALSRLEPHFFSVLVQTKLLTTALFSYLLLGKQLSQKQVLALVMLLFGVILAQMRGGQRERLLSIELHTEAIVGVFATLTIATLSGFAAVYTERVLKRDGPHSKDMLPYMQIQMATASLLVIGIFALVLDAPIIFEQGLWHGFDRAAMLAVGSSALGGLIVSAVLKYADSVLKGYATAASVVCTGALSAVLFGTELDSYFVLAAITVTASINLYNSKP